MVTLRLTVRGTVRLFVNVAVPVHIPAVGVGKFQFLHVLVNICYDLSFLLQRIIASVKWYLIVI